MRKIIVLTFLTLDGVMQGPGDPEEDVSGDFKFGGWTVPYFDEAAGAEMGKQMSGEYDLLLGRKTFEIFANYWPEHTQEWPQVNEIKKYVLSSTLTSSDWENSVFMKDVEEIKKLKAEDGPPLQVHGSSHLIQALMKEDLVDEFWLKIFPITLGDGKKLFGEGTIPAAFKLIDSKVINGVIFVSYKRDGEVKTGSF